GNGNSVINSKGKVVMEEVIHEENAEWVKFLYERFLEAFWSPGKLARYFNAHRVDKRANWDDRQVRQILRNPIYAGFEFYGKTYRDVDPDTGGVTIQTRPELEWL